MWFDSLMAKENILPKLKRCDEFGKITAYPDKEIETIYKEGKANGWDTPKIVKDAITKALLDHSELLKTPADRSA